MKDLEARQKIDEIKKDQERIRENIRFLESKLEALFMHFNLIATTADIIAVPREKR